MRSCGQLLILFDRGAEAPGTQGAPAVNLMRAMNLHHCQAVELDTATTRTRKHQHICSGFQLNEPPHQCPISGVAASASAKVASNLIDHRMVIMRLEFGSQYQFGNQIIALS